MNKEDFIKAAENEGFTFEFSDYWLDVYLDTRGEEVSIESFIRFLVMKSKS